MELKFRIQSDIFPEWIYSDSHYHIAFFFERWEAQYIDKPEFNPIIQQLLNEQWVDVYYNNPL